MAKWWSTFLPGITESFKAITGHLGDDVFERHVVENILCYVMISDKKARLINGMSRRLRNLRVLKKNIFIIWKLLDESAVTYTNTISWTRSLKHVISTFNRGQKESGGRAFWKNKRKMRRVMELHHSLFFLRESRVYLSLSPDKKETPRARDSKYVTPRFLHRRRKTRHVIARALYL